MERKDTHQHTYIFILVNNIYQPLLIRHRHKIITYASEQQTLKAGTVLDRIADSLMMVVRILLLLPKDFTVETEIK